MPHASHLRRTDFRLLAAIFTTGAAANGAPVHTHTLGVIMRGIFTKLGNAFKSTAVKATALGCVAIVLTQGWSKATAALILTTIAASLSDGGRSAAASDSTSAGR